MERQAAGVTLRLVKGDICERAVDAIVNAANNQLWMGGGVAGAIKRKGGEVIAREAMEKGPIPLGSATTTSAGKLPARYVIHAAVMGQDLQTNAKYIRLATASALEAARDLGLESIALPALGTGVGGFPLSEAASIMVQAALDHTRKVTSLKTIEFVLFDDAAYQAFAEALRTGEV